MFSSTRASPGGNYKPVYTNFSYSLQTGTLEERGIIKWRETDDSVKVGGTSNTSVYDLPFIQKYLNRLTITRFLPFCANFQPCSVTCKRENPTLEHYEQSVEDTKFWDFKTLSHLYSVHASANTCLSDNTSLNLAMAVSSRQAEFRSNNSCLGPFFEFGMTTMYSCIYYRDECTNPYYTSKNSLCHTCMTRIWCIF